MKSHTTDMTTGSTVKHIVFFALPTLIGNIFQQIYNIADSIIVGRFVGAEALAAVGSTSTITFLFFALCNGIGNGGGIIVSQYYGAHDDPKVKSSIVNTGFIMLIVPMIFGVTGFFSATALLNLLNTPADILPDAAVYIRYLCVGLLFVSLYNYLASMLRALGDARTPLYFLVLSAAINIILDLIFVCVLKTGIKGAALATVISQFLAAVCCGVHAYMINHYFRLKCEDLRISSQISLKVLKLGIPMSLQFALIAVSAMAVQRIVNSYGTTFVAAYTATNRIEQLIHQPFTTLGAAMSTYCGQNYGARKYDRVYDGYRKGFLVIALLAVFLTLSMQFLGGWITGLFVTDPEVIAIGAFGLRITSLFYIPLGLIYAVRGLLTGMGDAFFALFNGIVEVIGRFTIPLLMTEYMGMGDTGIWISAGVVWVISAITAWLRYYLCFSWINPSSDKEKPVDLQDGKGQGS